MEMYVIVDRIEGQYIVAQTEGGEMVNLPLLIAPAAREGDAIRIEIDYDETQRRKESIRGLMERLWEDD